MPVQRLGVDPSPRQDLFGTGVSTHIGVVEMGSMGRHACHTWSVWASDQRLIMLNCLIYERYNLGVFCG